MFTACTYGATGEAADMIVFRSVDASSGPSGDRGGGGGGGGGVRGLLFALIDSSAASCIDVRASKAGIPRDQFSS